MTLFDLTPSLAKCNEHVPDYIRNPVIKKCFFDYFGTYVTTRFRCIELSRSSGGSNTKRVSWETMSLNPTGLFVEISVA